MKKFKIPFLYFGMGFFVLCLNLSTKSGNAQVVPGSIESENVPFALSTPAEGYTWLVPVLIIRYLPTTDGIYLDPSKCPDFYVTGHIKLEDMLVNIRKCEARTKFCSEESSRFRGYKDATATPSLGYQVVAIINVYDHTPPGIIGQEGSVKFNFPDYKSIFSRLDVKHFIDDLGVKEVWLWQNEFNANHPSYDPAIHKPEDFRGLQESNMSSPVTGDISNSGRFDDLPLCSHTYTVYSGNIWRANDDSFGHIRGHQIEAMLLYINALKDGNTKLFWQDFAGRGPNFESPFGRAGDCHHPPNTRGDYDYANMTLVESDIEDWKPEVGIKKLVNADTWKNKPYQWPYGFYDPYSLIVQNWYVYWMQNMPGKDNLIPYSAEGEKMSNWWVFTGDWDYAIQHNIGLHEAAGLKQLTLKSGWNIISFDRPPTNPDLKVIFQPLIDDESLIKIQDENGESLEDFGIFGGWTNNIGDMSLTEGYKVKTKRNCQLYFQGSLPDLPFSIPLHAGWNIMGFPKRSAINAKTIFQQLIDRGTLLKVQDENGNSYEDFGIFGGWVNNIGNLLPGKGYKIKVKNAEMLVISNQAPVMPFNPTPDDSSRNILLKPLLSWECADPEGDAMTFDVFMGTTSNTLTLVTSNQVETSFIPPAELNPGTPYFWKIRAKDHPGNMCDGPAWMFTTRIVLEKFTDTRDGKVYSEVPIGNQIWMGENLSYLPAVYPASSLSGTIPYYYVYDYSGNDVGAAKATSSYLTFGVLYNWEAARTSCPAGWHLPTDEEIIILEKSLGMSQSDANSMGGSERSSGAVGKKIKSLSEWINNGNGDNTSELSIKPAGAMYFFIPGFGSLNDRTYLWTNTSSDADNAWYRNIFSGSDGLMRDSWAKSNGFCVRCLKN